MLISLNGENVNYKIESETNMGDIVDSMSSWLGKHNMVFSEIIINGQKMDITDDSWRQKKIKDTQKLDTRTLDMTEAYYIQLTTGRDFFYLLVETAQKGNIEGIKDFTTSWDEVRQHIIKLLQEDHMKLEKLFHDIEKSGFPLNPESDMNHLTQLFSSILEILIQRCSEFENPDQIAMETAKELVTFAETLDEVGIKFQTGKDKEAIETIIYLTEKLQILIRCLKLKRFTGTGTASLGDRLNSVLRELENALEASDTVQTGDLLEYEIKPILISLPSEISPGKREDYASTTSSIYQ